jgi:hypothetical protein
MFLLLVRFRRYRRLVVEGQPLLQTEVEGLDSGTGVGLNENSEFDEG